MSLYAQRMLKLWTKLLKAETKGKKKKAAKLEQKLILKQLQLNKANGLS